MARTALTDARIAALNPRKKPYEVRDGKLRGFGVRVTPSGKKRFFVHCQHDGERVWKIVGDAGSIDIREARSRATGMLAAIRRGENAPPRPEEALFEAVAASVFSRYERTWKPRTLLVNRGYLKNQILPRFAGRPVAEIDRGRSATGSPRCARRRSRPTARCRCFRSSCGRPRRWGSGRRAPTRAGVSAATAARGASASCRMKSSAACRRSCPRMWSRSRIRSRSSASFC